MARSASLLPITLTLQTCLRASLLFIGPQLPILVVPHLKCNQGFVIAPGTTTMATKGEGFTMSGGGKHYLVGIVANAINDKCNIRTFDNRTLILNVFAYNDWIRSKTGILGPALLPRPYADILWRNTNGGLAIWFMKGGTSIGQSI